MSRLNNREEWVENDPPAEEVHVSWEHEETGNSVQVSEFDDGTWDAFLNERLIGNYDEKQEALDKAEEIVEDGRESYSRVWK